MQHSNITSVLGFYPIPKSNICMSATSFESSELNFLGLVTVSDNARHLHMGNPKFTGRRCQFDMATDLHFSLNA